MIKTPICTEKQSICNEKQSNCLKKGKLLDLICNSKVAFFIMLLGSYSYNKLKENESKWLFSHKNFIELREKFQRY